MAEQTTRVVHLTRDNGDTLFMGKISLTPQQVEAIERVGEEAFTRELSRVFEERMKEFSLRAAEEVLGWRTSNTQVEGGRS